MSAIRIGSNYNKAMRKTAIIILLFSTIACGKMNQFTYLLENSTNETIKIEGYSIPFNYPEQAQAIETGELTISENQTLLIGDYKLDYNDVLYPHEFLRYYFEIVSVDSLVMTFENGKKAYFLSSEWDNPLTPFDIENWLLEIGVGFKFNITQVHKDAAQ